MAADMNGSPRIGAPEPTGRISPTNDALGPVSGEPGNLDGLGLGRAGLWLGLLSLVCLFFGVITLNGILMFLPLLVSVVALVCCIKSIARGRRALPSNVFGIIFSTPPLLIALAIAFIIFGGGRSTGVPGGIVSASTVELLQS